MDTFRPQLCKHLHLELEKRTPNIQHDYMVTEKVDGIYAYATYSTTTGWSNIYSRAHRELPSMLHCKELYLDTLAKPPEDCRLLMEAYIPDTKFHITNGIFNRSTGDYKANDVHFIVHDIIPLTTPLPALTRFKAISSLQFNSPRMQRAELLLVSSDIDLWKRCFDKVINAGGEGIVLKQADGLYQPGKRNSSLLKIKEEIEADLLCTELYYTIGEKGNSNMNLILVSKAGVETTVRVAKHEDIEEFERDNTSVVGQVVKIKAMKRLEGGKFREPRFDYVREDKESWDID